MDGSTPGLPVLHHLPELVQTNLWLWTTPCRAIQDRWVIAKSSDKTWSTGGGKGKPPHYTCCENLMNCIKGQKDMTPKDKSPRSENVPYATGEEQRRITNSPRMNEAAGPKWIRIHTTGQHIKITLKRVKCSFYWAQCFCWDVYIINMSSATLNYDFPYVSLVCLSRGPC